MRRLTLIALFIIVAGVFAIIARPLAFHALPAGWTGEAQRLADLLGAHPGTIVADIGAGSGAMTVEMARRVGPSGLVYSTEIDPERRDAVAGAVHKAGVTNVRIIAAGERDTNLPDACCDGIFLRNVFHHIGDPSAFARSLHRALRDDGRVVIIDFAPGALWYLGGDHGVSPAVLAETMTRAGFALDEHIEDWGGRMFASVFSASENTSGDLPRPAGDGQ